MITTTLTTAERQTDIENGLRSILSHFDNLWPRMISTYATRGGQRLVNNVQEVMAWFKAANFLDCRISAYPKYTDYYIHRTGIAPSVLLVDIDKEHFKTSEEFELAATRTYSNFHAILGSQPTQLWTGGGYHFLTPQQVPVLEKVEEFSKFDQPSRRFIQFEERLLTDNKGDQSHWSTVSFNNCMLRIPCSLNSKPVQFDDKGVITDIPYDARVRIEKYWDGNTPSISRILLMQYHNYLKFSEIRDIQRRKAREVEQRTRNRKYGRIYGHARGKYMNLHDYGYIEKLINKPIHTHRNYCVWKILVPYCINVKGLSRSQTFDVVKTWLDKCKSITRLDFAPKQKLDYELDHVGKFTPIRQYQLKEGHPMLYALLEKEGVIC